MENFNNLTLEKINKLGIYELREVARRAGVYSPTTKKAKELKDEILKIMLGEKTPVFKKSKLGRPPKSINFINEKVIDAIIPKEIYDIAQNKNSDPEEIAIKELIFKKGTSFIQSDITVDEEVQKTKGYLRKTVNNNYYFWNQNHDMFHKGLIIYLPKLIVEKYNLREGDKIEGLSKIFISKNCGVINELITLNNETITESFKRREQGLINKYVLPTELVECLGEKFHKGGRAIAVFKDRSLSVLKLLEQADVFINSNYNVVFIGTELPPEFSAVLYTREKIEKFTTHFGDGLEVTYNTIINSINHITALASEKRNILVLVYDIVGIANILNLYFSTIEKASPCTSGTQLAKTLFGFGRCLENGTTITVVTSILESEKNEYLIKNELTKVASCIISQ